MKKYKSETLKWSNLFFLIPLVMAVVYGVYWYALVLLALFIVSFDFHFFKEAKEVYYLDIIFSSLLMLSNFVLLFLGHWALPFSIIAIIFALIALSFYFRKSDQRSASCANRKPRFPVPREANCFIYCILQSTFHPLV